MAALAERSGATSVLGAPPPPSLGAEQLRLFLLALRDAVVEQDERLARLEALAPNSNGVQHAEFAGGRTVTERPPTAPSGAGGAPGRDRASEFFQPIATLLEGIQVLHSTETNAKRRALLAEMRSACTTLRSSLDSLFADAPSSRAIDASNGEASTRDRELPRQKTAMSSDAALTETAAGAVPRASAETPHSPEAEANHRRSRVLIVEDDTLDARITQAALEPLGCAITTAASGSEAIALFKANPFDLIVMDCQLPGVDGHEATRQIRAVDGQRVPIIALTANAMAGDRERCLESGMDDFIAKPFSLRVLRETAARWMGHDEPPTPLQSTTGALDLQRLRVIVNETVGIPLATLAELFTADGAARLRRIRASAESGELEALRRQAHALAGAAGNIGADAVLAAARKLEHVIPDVSGSELEKLVSILAEELGRVDRDLQRLVRDGLP